MQRFQATKRVIGVARRQREHSKSMPADATNNEVVRVRECVTRAVPGEVKQADATLEDCAIADGEEEAEGEIMLRYLSTLSDVFDPDRGFFLRCCQVVEWKKSRQ